MDGAESKFLGFLKISMWTLIYLFLVPIVLGVMAAIIPQIGTWMAVAIIIVGLASFARPFEQIGLTHKASSIAAVAGGIIAIFVAMGISDGRDKERLAELRTSDPMSYLAELRDTDKDKWLDELAVLAPEDYSKEKERLAEEERVAELARQAREEKAAAVKAERIIELEKQAEAIPASATDQNIRIYQQLLDLDAGNQEYQDKLDHYVGIRDLVVNQQRSPEAFVKIVDFTWTKEGFDSIMEIDITLKNELPFAIKDIEIRCTHFAPSGTRIDSNERVIFEIIQSGKSRTFRDFNMGFIVAQVEKTGCVVTDVTRM